MQTDNGPTYLPGKSPPKKMKKSAEAEPKSALQTLNEMMPGLKYDCRQMGLHHEPVFTVQVTVNDHVFEGSAATKKQAMRIAAEQAVEEIRSTRPPMTASNVQSAIDGGKNPVSVIKEMCPDAEFHLGGFIMSLSVAGQTFQGTGRSKRQAEMQAARKALSQLCGVAFEPGDQQADSECLQLADHVASSVGLHGM